MKAKVTRELSYLECVKRVCGDKYILCNNMQQDDAFMEMYMLHQKKEKTTKSKA